MPKIPTLFSLSVITIFRTKDINVPFIGNCNRVNSHYGILYTWSTNKMYLAN